MSTTETKSKWDQPGPRKATESISPPPGSAETPGSTKKIDATEAAAQAAAIAAKIAAQFASGDLNGGNSEHQFVKDIDINDVRNRYMLTKGSTQQQIQEESGGAVVSTKGVWYPDRNKATEKDPPLHLHVTAPTAEILKKATDKIDELLAMDLSLIEERKREKRKWPEEKLPIGLESIRNFNVRAKVVGPSGTFVKYIQHETSARVQVKGLGSGFIDQETGREDDEPLFIHITAPEEGQVARAKVLAEDLLLVVRSEHAKQLARIQQEQAALHAAQMQYAAYGTMGYGMVGGQSPAAPGSAPPPPPDQPPPPPPGSSGENGAQPVTGADQDPMAAYSAYWAAYGYDVNSPQFKEWLTQQYQQYSAQGAAPGASGGAMPPAPSGPGSAPPPPPPGPPPA
ncbi:KH domain-containing protein [Ephemerocybe angulata]|uniref:KH domain-containing protein n=1 Tax=Ephemerocybe angulata TaxID=980116 RepID=A0A8H6IC96_9AGAR|nr:KH domain-containing protein [Tulosesus angulatus]